MSSMISKNSDNSHKLLENSLAFKDFSILSFYFCQKRRNLHVERVLICMLPCNFVPVIHIITVKNTLDWPKNSSHLYLKGTGISWEQNAVFIDNTGKNILPKV